MIWLFGVAVAAYMFCLTVIFLGPQRVERIVNWRRRD